MKQSLGFFVQTPLDVDLKNKQREKLGHYGATILQAQHAAGFDRCAKLMCVVTLEQRDDEVCLSDAVGVR